jgi:hypothetical protein
MRFTTLLTLLGTLIHLPASLGQENCPPSYGNVTAVLDCSNITLPSNLTNTPTALLPLIFSSASAPQDPLTLGQIRNTLALYPLPIDGKNFQYLGLVFTDDAVANYSAPLNLLTGLPTIASVPEESLAPVTTQHLLGTQVIDVLDICTARSLTYFRAAHFGTGIYEGEAVFAYGQ